MQIHRIMLDHNDIPLAPPRILNREVGIEKWDSGYFYLLEHPALQEIRVAEHFVSGWKWILARRNGEYVMQYYLNELLVEERNFLIPLYRPGGVDVNG
jgi:hypothetical protein